MGNLGFGKKKALLDMLIEPFDDFVELSLARLLELHNRQRHPTTTIRDI